MKYKEFGSKNNPVVFLLHGEFLSWWAFSDIIDRLKRDYHIVAPVIDGHGEDGDTTFLSIQESARTIIQYIDDNYQGKVRAICGVTLGAQIAAQILSQRSEIAEYAVIESTRVVPRKNLIYLQLGKSRLFYDLYRGKWMSKMISKTLGIKPEAFSKYRRDILQMSFSSWRNIQKSRAEYTTPSTLGMSKSKVLIVVRTEQIRAMDRSVRFLMNTIPNANVCIVPEMKRGGFSSAHSVEYLALMEHFMV